MGKNDRDMLIIPRDPGPEPEYRPFIVPAAPVGTLPDASGRCFHCGDRATDSCPRCGKEFDERCRSAHAHDDVFQNQASQPPTPEPVTLTETTCERCGGPNPIAWHTPSPLWNAVMRESGHEEIGFICPRCFIEVAQERGIDGSWQLSIDGRDFAGTVSPDGRVWNPTTCLWEPVTPEPVCRECGAALRASISTEWGA